MSSIGNFHWFRKKTLGRRCHCCCCCLSSFTIRIHTLHWNFAKNCQFITLSFQLKWCEKKQCDSSIWIEKFALYNQNGVHVVEYRSIYLFYLVINLVFQKTSWSELLRISFKNTKASVWTIAFDWGFPIDLFKENTGQANANVDLLRFEYMQNASSNWIMVFPSNLKPSTSWNELLNWCLAIIAFSSHSICKDVNARKWDCFVFDILHTDTQFHFELIWIAWKYSNIEKISIELALNWNLLCNI